MGGSNKGDRKEDDKGDKKEDDKGDKKNKNGDKNGDKKGKKKDSNESKESDESSEEDDDFFPTPLPTDFAFVAKRGDDKMSPKGEGKENKQEDMEGNRKEGKI